MANTKYNDLTGVRFGMITVLSRAENKGNKIYWNCKCDCGTVKTIRGDSLVRGKIVSCGCYNTENCRRLGKSRGMKNTFSSIGDVAYGTDNLGNVFQVSAKDVEKIKPYYWHYGSNGYFKANIDGRQVLLHRYIMCAPEGFEVDHINHNPADNKRENLRVCTHQQNMCNARIKKNNKSNRAGVFYDRHRLKWVATLSCKNEEHRKRFGSLQEAIRQREAWEKEYFGEFAPMLSTN